MADDGDWFIFEVKRDDLFDNGSAHEDEGDNDSEQRVESDSKKGDSSSEATASDDETKHLAALRIEIASRLRALCPSQPKAAEAVIQGRKSRFKGLILADPPGTGKTYSVLLAIHKDYDPGDGPCVVMVPENHGQHWMDEIDKFFQEGELPAVLLNNESIAPSDLFRYRVVIVTYDYLVAERRRMVQFEVHLAQHSRGDRDTAPPKPGIALFSDIFEIGGVRSFGKYLVLDDAHHLRDYQGVTYKTVKMFRARFEACIAVTATPLVDSWFDAYALLSMLKGHAITSPAHMLAHFSDTQLGKDGVQRRREPEGQKLIRLKQIMNAVTLRRPSPYAQAFEWNMTIRAIMEDITRPDDPQNPCQQL